MTWLIPVSVALAVLATVYLVLQLLRQDQGTPQMQAIAAAIREGAFAFLARQYRTIALLSVPIAGLLLFLFSDGLYAAAAFLVGAAASALSGFIGMWTAVTANLRVAAAARSSLASALTTALRGGAVTGLAVTALPPGAAHRRSLGHRTGHQCDHRRGRGL